MKKTLLILSCALFATSLAFAQKTWQVTAATGGADVPGTLPAQVAAAADGDIIELSGEYTEITVPDSIYFTNKTITILGKNKTIQVATDDYKLFSVFNGGLKISDCTLKGPDFTGTEYKSHFKFMGSCIFVYGNIPGTPALLEATNINFAKGKSPCGAGVNVRGIVDGFVKKSTFTNLASTYAGGAGFAADGRGVAFTDRIFFTVEDCLFDGIMGKSTGGAIVSVEGKLKLINSTVVNCTGSWGIVSNDVMGSTLHIDGCYIANNTAETYGGGVFNKGGLKFVGNTDVLFSMKNTTIIGNKATNASPGMGVGFCSQTAANVYNCTIVNNEQTNSSKVGAGIYIYANEAAVLASKIVNCIVVGNKNTSGASDIFLGKGKGSLFEGGNNIYGVMSPEIGATDNMTGNIEYNGTDPLFAEEVEGKPVAKDNGGSTFTIALAANSIAAEAGAVGEAIPTVDQRGYARKAKPSIGAFELGGVNGLQNVDEMTNNATFGPNPASSIVNLKSEGIVKIYSGGMLIKDSVSKVNNMDVSDLPAGFYIITIDGVGSQLVIIR